MVTHVLATMLKNIGKEKCQHNNYIYMSKKKKSKLKSIGKEKWQT